MLEPPGGDHRLVGQYGIHGCPDSAALVGYRLVEARDERGVFEAPGAVWAEPDIGEAAAHLARLADDVEARRALGQRGRVMAETRLGDGALRNAVQALGLLDPGMRILRMAREWAH